MFNRNTQLKIMFVSMFFSTVVACICLYAKPQKPAYSIAKAGKVYTASN
jgi:hypothetical protein